MLLPTIIADQFYPRMARTYGKTREHGVVKLLLLKQVVIKFAVTIPLIMVIYFISPPLIKLYLPKYVPGIKVARIILFGLLFLPIAYSMGGFLNILNKQILYLAVQILAVFINLGLSIYCVKKGMGLKGVATAAVITYAVYVLLLILPVGSGFRQNKNISTL